MRVSTSNFIAVAAIKEHFFENEIENSFEGIKMWSSYCHSLLTGLSPRPSKALSNTSSSVPTSVIFNVTCRRRNREQKKCTHFHHGYSILKVDMVFPTFAL